MVLENSYTDIFTEFDDAIFSDGSIDPMGLRMIWTHLGNSIFHSKLNTISTSIRFYTINLFHHHIIYQCEKRFEDKIIRLTGRPPYNNRQDLYDGIIIFLESMLAHAIIKGNIKDPTDESALAPGLNKLNGLKQNKPNDPKVTYLFVDKREGILVRHLLLGIHGRHKGPFQQMGIFNPGNYYSNKDIWKEVETQISVDPWNSTTKTLLRIIESYILNISNNSSSPIKIRIDDNLISEELIDGYRKILLSSNIKQLHLINFWEEKLGLMDGTALLVYKLIKENAQQVNYEGIIRKASAAIDDIEKTQYLKAICAIEPFLTCIEKITNRLLQRGTTVIDNSLSDFIKSWLNRGSIDIEEIYKYLNLDFLSSGALSRLRELVSVYVQANNSNDPDLFITGLLNYHSVLMKNRNAMPWISISSSKTIKQNRSFVYSVDAQESFNNDRWVNDYYLSTVLSLYKGLY